MKIVQKDPRTDFRLGKERIETITWQAKQAAAKMVSPAPDATDRIVFAAEQVLRDIHERKMKGRLAHFLTTCRVDGCMKQPRTPSRKKLGRKTRRSTSVFCAGHAGVKNLMAKSDVERLKADASLRIVL